MISRIPPFILASLFFAGGSQAIIFTETWENPVLPSGGSTSLLPAGWLTNGAIGTLQYVTHPGNTMDFSPVQPIDPPAGGNQLLVLAGKDSSMFRMSGAAILPDVEYTLSAAIGNAFTIDEDTSWSIQLWADTNANGNFDGILGDTFIGQEYGTSGTAVNPAPGAWRLNSYAFNSQDYPTLIGSELIVFVNNFGGAASFYDNVTLLPEPSLGAMAGVAAMVLCSRRHRYSRLGDGL